MDVSLKLQSLGEKLRQEQDSWHTPDLEGERKQWLARAALSDHEQRGHFGVWNWVAALGAAAALAVFVMGWLGPSYDGAGELELRGAAPGQAVGSWIAAPADTSLPLEFSDGSRVQLQPLTRARLLSLTSRGAHITLESGTAAVSVEKRAGADWRWHAGPFLVKVVGTSFDLSWDPEQDLLEVVLHSGRVDLSGCVFGSGRSLNAGETLRAWCKKDHYEIVSGERRKASAEQSPTHVDIPEAVRAPLGPSAAVAAGPSAAVAAATPEPQKRVTSWKALAAAGDYKAAYTVAKLGEFEQALQTGSAATLMELADVARFAGQLADAIRVYRTVRSRFAGSGQAATAAYSLARIEFDQRGAYASAARWFEAYLGEMPSGSLAREALGRLIEAHQRAGHKKAAKETAESYLARYPSGPHSALAKSLTGP